MSKKNKAPTKKTAPKKSCGDITLKESAKLIAKELVVNLNRNVKKNSN